MATAEEQRLAVAVLSITNCLIMKTDLEMMEARFVKRRGLMNLPVFSLLMLPLAFSILAGDAFGKTMYVKADATGANNGNSWANAYTDLQSALTAVTSGDEIWVAAGTYKPTSGADRNVSFVMKQNVAMYGGFMGTESSRLQRNWTKNSTILSGEIGNQADVFDNSLAIVTGASLLTLDGVTVTGAFSTGTMNAGALCTTDATSVTVTNCIFKENSSGTGAGICNLGGSVTVSRCTFDLNDATIGGGIYNTTSGTLIVDHCLFTGNSAMFGGGIANGNGNNQPDRPPGKALTVSSSTFIGNSASGSGGALYACFGAQNVMNCSFSGNSASNTGGGVHSESVSRIFPNSSLTMTNCIFTGNSGAMEGGGLNVSGKANVINCTFVGNSAWGRGGGIHHSISSTFTNCILWGNAAESGPELYNYWYNGQSATPTLRNCVIKNCGGSGASWDASLGIDGGGNIQNDPLFMSALNPAGPDGILGSSDDGLRIQTGSPCINAGLAAGAPGADILANARTGAPDIGAYEYRYPGPKNSVLTWRFYE